MWKKKFIHHVFCSLFPSPSFSLHWHRHFSYFSFSQRTFIITMLYTCWILEYWELICFITWRATILLHIFFSLSLFLIQLHLIAYANKIVWSKYWQQQRNERKKFSCEQIVVVESSMRTKRTIFFLLRENCLESLFHLQQQQQKKKHEFKKERKIYMTNITHCVCVCAMAHFLLVIASYFISKFSAIALCTRFT